MDFETKIQEFLTLQTLIVTLLYCLTLFMLTLGIRRAGEGLRPTLKTNKWWREGVLPFAPIILGGALPSFLGESFPWPALVSKPGSLLAMFGAACGLGCGWVYARFRSVLTAWVKSPVPTKPGTPVPADTPAEPANALPAPTSTELGLPSADQNAMIVDIEASDAPPGTGER